MNALLRWNEALFPLCALSNCVFASATFNFGPRTVTFPHLDFLNLAWGWCFITALGSFNHELGGHLILWDLWLIIEFPPVMIIFRHSNISIQQDEKRFAITQYTSAGIFRFVNSFKTNITLEQEMSKEEARAWANTAKIRSAEGVKMYLTLDELRQRAFI